MSYNICDRCGGMFWGEPCECVEFKVGFYGFPIGDAETVWATDAEFAAEDFAARRDGADYEKERALSIWRSDGVHVRDVVVRSETTLDYHVTTIVTPESGSGR
jgi:hypothetical protein